MKIKTIVESIPGNLNKRYRVEIIDGDVTISVGTDHRVSDDQNPMADAARNAVYNLRSLADQAERELIKIGVLKKKA